MDKLSISRNTKPSPVKEGDEEDSDDSTKSSTDKVKRSILDKEDIDSDDDIPIRMLFKRDRTDEDVQISLETPQSGPFSNVSDPTLDKKRNATEADVSEVEAAQTDVVLFHEADHADVPDNTMELHSRKRAISTHAARKIEECQSLFSDYVLATNNINEIFLPKYIKLLEDSSLEAEFQKLFWEVRDYTDYVSTNIDEKIRLLLLKDSILPSNQKDVFDLQYDKYRTEYFDAHKQLSEDIKKRANMNSNFRSMEHFPVTKYKDIYRPTPILPSMNIDKVHRRLQKISDVPVTLVASTSHETMREDKPGIVDNTLQIVAVELNSPFANANEAMEVVAGVGSDSHGIGSSDITQVVAVASEFNVTAVGAMEVVAGVGSDSHGIGSSDITQGVAVASEFNVTAVGASQNLIAAYSESKTTLNTSETTQDVVVKPESENATMVNSDAKQVAASSYFTIETELLRDVEYQKLAARILGVVDLINENENVVDLPMFGLPNKSWNCWMNATVQILFRIGDINQMLSKDAANFTHSPLFDRLHKLFQACIRENKESLQPFVEDLLNFCCEHMGIPRNVQLDPAEFLKKIIHQLHLDFRKPYIYKSNFSIIMSDDTQAKHAMAKRDWNEYMMSERISPLMEMFYFQVMRTYTCSLKDCRAVSVDFDIDNVLTFNAPEKVIRKISQVPRFSPPTILSLLKQKFSNKL